MPRPVLLATAGLAGLVGALVSAPSAGAQRPVPDLAPLGTYATGVFDEAAAEIVEHDPLTQRLFTVNANSGAVDVLDTRDPSDLRKVTTLSAAGLRAADGSTIDAGAVVNSVSVSDGVLAVAVEAGDKVSPGWVALFRTSGATPFLGAVRVGSLPDMVTWTPEGDALVVANEGEPADDFSSDPEGTVSVVAVTDPAALRQADVRTARFTAFEGAVPAGVRVYGPDVPVPAGQPAAGRVARNLEPEYVAVDGRTAYVTLQEANAIAVVDLRSARVERLMPLGTKDWSVGAGLDASDRDGGISLRRQPVQGLYLPDTIATSKAKGRTYLVTANEGDSREWGSYVDIARLGSSSYVLCPDAFPNAAELKKNENLGRLNVSLEDGRRAGASCFERIHTLGGRSFSVWTTDGKLVSDSGSQLEQRVAAQLPTAFNATNDDNDSFDNRSDDKGPEPEGLTVGKVAGRTYAFVGLERVGGVMTFDITDPSTPSFVDYVNNRDFSQDAESPAAGDLGPEGLALISAGDSPTGRDLLAVGNEISGTTTVFSVR